MPVERLVRHPRGGWFFYVWEACGVALVAVFALLDDGARSPYVSIFYVLLAHAALAYPPAGMALTGAGIIGAYLGLAIAAGSPGAAELVFVVVTLAVAAANCAFASYNHVLAYRRTTAYAEQIAVLAERDGLTGCFNHRTFHQRLQAEAAVAGEGHPLALLLVDVDDFKSVNEQHGHPAGDAVLALIGAALERLSRTADAAGRLGGDEFALLLPGTREEGAVQVADRLCGEVREAAAEYGVTVSVGVAVTRTRGGRHGTARGGRPGRLPREAGRTRPGRGRRPPPRGAAQPRRPRLTAAAELRGPGGSARVPGGRARRSRAAATERTMRLVLVGAAFAAAGV